jgi:thiosulfate/3-mercaptopyruvate sulfurtransferase
MHHATLITPAELKGLLTAGTPVVLLDCGFDLADPGAGERIYGAGHVPGARYVHLDRDLAGAKTGHNGRHPLPDRAEFAARVGQWGVAPGVQVVAYDAQGGPYAARAWWLLQWLGHAQTAVLDGGMAAWSAAGGAVSTEPPGAAAKPPYPMQSPDTPAMPVIDARTLQDRLPDLRILDARAAERFRGDVEPLDAVAGHIPGAVNRFFKDNLTPDGRFKPADSLRADFLALGVKPGAADVVQQCGSGVTACHNLLAMTQAGLGVSTLYPGSWSEWSSDASRPMAKG